MPADLARLRLNGRATDSQFSQNPIPVLRSIGHALAALHSEPLGELASATEREVAAVRRHVESGNELPSPFTRVSPETVLAVLDDAPSPQPLVATHGSPIVGAAVLRESVTTFDDHGSAGADPAERDLAIVIRSVAETFSPESATVLLDTYVADGGRLPDPKTLDWYGLLAAFR